MCYNITTVRGDTLKDKEITQWKTSYRQRLRSILTHAMADRLKSIDTNLLKAASSGRLLISVIASFAQKPLWKLRSLLAKLRSFVGRMRYMKLLLEELLKSSCTGQEFSDRYKPNGERLNSPRKKEVYMKIIITTKDIDNIIGIKEAIAMRLEDVVDIVRIDVGDDDGDR
jgi:hypothetical protein